MADGARRLDAAGEEVLGNRHGKAAAEDLAARGERELVHADEHLGLEVRGRILEEFAEAALGDELDRKSVV